MGALFTFDFIIGRSVRTVIKPAVADINRDLDVLRGTKLSVLSQGRRAASICLVRNTFRVSSTIMLTDVEHDLREPEAEVPDPVG
jgi:hypothetical protein